MSGRGWGDTLSSIYRRAHSKFYVAMVAYWYHLFPDGRFTEEQRLVSLYYICHAYYEENNEHPTPPAGMLTVRPKMHYQIAFLNFYRFRPSAAERLLDLHHQLKCSTGEIADRAIDQALRLCIAFYLRGKYLDQSTQDLLCLALLLHALHHLFPEFDEEELWSLMCSSLIHRYEPFRQRYLNDRGEWLLNHRQMETVSEYHFRLDQVDLPREMGKWPIIEMIPDDHSIHLLPPKPKGCCTVHGHSYHEERLAILQYDCRRLGHGANSIYVCKKGCSSTADRELACLNKHWKQCTMCFPVKPWRNACAPCKQSFVHLEDHCFAKHNLLCPERCLKGCAQLYKVALYRMKECTRCRGGQVYCSSSK